MSTGKLKAQYNRVRTSNALQSNSIWATTIGIEHDQGGNSAVEALLPAPTRGGPGKAAKRQAAQDLIAATGFQPAVTSYEGLIALAKASGQGMDTGARGACKICGGLGHLTKQCKNVAPRAADAAAAGAGPSSAHQLLAADVDELSDLSSLSTSSSSGSDSDSSTSSDSSGGRKRKRSKSKDKERGRERDSSSKKHRKSSSKSKDRSKDKKHKKHKSKDKKSKHKKSRR